MTNLKLHEDCKVLSQAVYKDEKPKNINGWEYVYSSSNPKSGYYSEIYKKDDKIILVIEGTDPKSAEDLKNYYDMSWVLLPKQVNDAKNTCLNVLKLILHCQSRRPCY